MKKFQLTKYVNPSFLAIIGLLLLYGTIMVNSATSGSGLKRQLFGIAVGAVLLVFFWWFDYRKMKDWIVPLFILDALLMLSPRIPGLGYNAKGATSWLALGGKIRLFQPSEPAKLVTIILLASIMVAKKKKIGSLKDYLKILGLSFIPVILILTQPDLGTGLVFIAIALGMLIMAGAKARWIIATVVIGLSLGIGMVWIDGIADTKVGHDVLLKDYQKNRLLVFVDQNLDPTGAGYNLKQSKIAIGSGQTTGKGLGAGTQGNLNFLPERHTDFIFSVVGEELGFAGAMALLALYLALLMVSLNIAVSSVDLFGTLLVTGVMSMWVFQILENIGMTIGLMPITGIPLPFMSYGSSFMVTNMACVGVLLSVWSHRAFQSTAKGM